MLRKLQEQPEAVAVGRHGPGTRVSLRDEPFQNARTTGPKLPEDRGSVMRHLVRRAPAKRCTANARSSGIAVTYQYVSETLAWPT